MATETETLTRRKLVKQQMWKAAAAITRSPCYGLSGKVAVLVENNGMIFGGPVEIQSEDDNKPEIAISAIDTIPQGRTVQEFVSLMMKSGNSIALICDRPVLGKILPEFQIKRSDNEHLYTITPKDGQGKLTIYCSESRQERQILSKSS